MNKFWVGLFIVWPIAAILSCLVSPAMGWWFPGNREAATQLGQQIDNLFFLILYIVTIVFIATHIALAYVLWHGCQNTQEKAWYTHGNHNLELLWTIVPSGILLFIALYQMDVWMQFRVEAAFPNEIQAAVSEPIAEVTARQFEWRIRYPGIDPTTGHPKLLRPKPQSDDLYTVNDLHVPINRPVGIRLKSADVQHSFFVPGLRIKQDAVPGQVIPIWFEVMREQLDDDGNNIGYDLTCAELCGWGHYKMRGRVFAQTEEEFRTYLKKLHHEQFYDGVTKPANQSLIQKE